MAKALVSCTSPDAVPSCGLETTLLDSSQELVFAVLRGAFEVPFFFFGRLERARSSKLLQCQALWNELDSSICLKLELFLP